MDYFDQQQRLFVGEQAIDRKQKEMMHLLLDLYGCRPDLLADEAHLRQFLNELPERLGMRKAKADSPSLYFIDAVSDPNDAGHSGLVLAANHISLHAWPPYRMINIDVFSLLDFDEDQVIAFARAMFAPEDIEKNLVRRATCLPHQNGGAGHPPTTGTDTVERKTTPPFVPHRCLYRGPGGCFRSTGSAMIRYCELHKDLLLQP